jgi:hypothetical protein
MSEFKDLSLEEMQKIVAEKEKATKEEQLRTKKGYEEKRDKTVSVFVDQALAMAKVLKDFKAKTSEMMQKQQEELLKYSGLPKHSKGGFSITSSDNEFRVTRTRSTKPIWDERSQEAVNLIHEFLESTVKKRDKKIFDILISFIAKDEAGNLEYDKVMTLLHHEDKYDDPRWKKGLELIRESYRIDQTGFGYDFYIKDQEGKWERIDLSFPTIKIEVESDEDSNEVQTETTTEDAK